MWVEEWVEVWGEVWVEVWVEVWGWQLDAPPLQKLRTKEGCI